MASPGRQRGGESRAVLCSEGCESQSCDPGGAEGAGAQDTGQAVPEAGIAPAGCPELLPLPRGRSSCVSTASGSMHGGVT